MTALILKNISKAFQGHPVLHGVDLTLRRGEKVGLVGRNGCGKTTLLQILAAASEPDSGERQVPGARSIGFIKQEEDFKASATVMAAASEGQGPIRAIEEEMDRITAGIDSIGEIEGSGGRSSEKLDRLVQRQADLQEEYRLLGGYMGPSRVQAVLSGLGFPPGRFGARPDTLSGGEIKRLQIARILLGGHDVLLLDEPGNHLDINGCEWLTRYLRDYTGTLVVISHDRYLLNAVVDRIVELESGRLRSYKGDYDAFAAAREMDREAGRKSADQRKRLVAKEEEFIRRTHYGQKAKQAKSRAKRLERLVPVDGVREIQRPNFAFFEKKHSGEVVLTLEGVGALAGEKNLFKGIDLTLERGQVLGVIGPNGSGKTTLLKMILGLLTPGTDEPESTADSGIQTCGLINLSPTVHAVYFDQNLSELTGRGSVLDEIRIDWPTATDEELRSHLARFLIRGDEADKRVADLSGGEKSRVLLAKIALQGANLLILDEPTNHLDIYSREALEQALTAYAGSVIMVTHDRRLLDSAMELVLLLNGERTRLYHGSYSDLMTEVQAAGRKRPGTDGAATPRTGRQKRPQSIGEKSTVRIKRRHTFDELEELIISKEERVVEIESAFYTEEVYTDAKLYRELEDEHRALKAELEELHKEWDTWA